VGTSTDTLAAGTTPLVHRLRYRVRRTLDRVDNEPVRRARGLLRVLRNHPPDVIYFGESTVSFIGPTDVDRRRLYTMVDDGLGPHVSMHVVHGASFSTDIFDAYLGLLKSTQHRPLIVVPLCVRFRFTPWIEHPVHGHKKALQRIREVDPTKGAWRVHGAWPRPNQVDFDEFHRVPFSSLLGDLTVGDYVTPIAEFQRSGDDVGRVRMLYAYHHGGLLELDSPVMEAVTQMGRTIRELGCPAVVYQTPVPLETGTTLLGQELADRTAASFAAINAAYRLGAGEGVEIIESGTCFTDSEFIDPADATEHLNEFGRRHLAEMILSAIKQRLAPD
jgi:hypothetical protein